MAVVFRLQRTLIHFSPLKRVGSACFTLDNGVNNYKKSFDGSSFNQTRKSSYAKSPFVEKIKEQYEYEVVKNPPEWQFVERLLPFATIPKVAEKSEYPSGWIPPKEEALDLPFYIRRTKNHMLPIYLHLKFRGLKKTSAIKRIEGDIWLLNDEIKSMLQSKYNRTIPTRVHELNKCIEVKGDYVIDLQNWAYSKGF